MSHNVSDRASNDHLHWSRNAHRSSPPEPSAFVGALMGGGASLAAAIYTKTLQNYRRTISNFCAVRPTVFDREVLAFDVARFLQPFAERRHEKSGRFWKSRLRYPTTGIAVCCARASISIVRSHMRSWATIAASTESERIPSVSWNSRSVWEIFAIIGISGNGTKRNMGQDSFRSGQGQPLAPVHASYRDPAADRQ